MADASPVSSQRSRPGMVSLHIRAKIFGKRSRILRCTHHGYLSGILYIHTLPHSGNHGGDLPDPRTVFFSRSVRAARAISLALLGNCHNDCSEYFDKKPDWLDFSSRNYLGVSVSYGRPKENLEAPSSVEHAGIPRRCRPMARARSNPQSGATRRAGKRLLVVLLRERTIHALSQQAHSSRLRQSAVAALLCLAASMGPSLVRIFLP